MNDRLPADVVVVIEHEDERLLNRLKYLVYHEVDRSFRKSEHLLVGLAQIRKDRLAEFGTEILDTTGDITQKHDRVGVSVIQLIPDGLPVLITDEIGDQRGLPTPCVGSHQRDRRAEIRLQFFRKAWPFEQLGGGSRWKEFCPKKETLVLHASESGEAVL